jgi:hypothetical protein
MNNENIPNLGQTQPDNNIVLPNETQVTENLEVRALEAEKGKNKKMAVKLIREGWSKNGYYYSKDVAESVADHITKRPQMYMDHAMGMRQGRSFKDLVAVAVDSYKKDGAAYAVVEMVDNPATNWLYEMAKKFPGQVGASIDARAKIKPYEAQEDEDTERRQKYVVEEIVFLNSVDFVTYPSAGGGVVEIQASEEIQKAYQQLDQILENWGSGVAKLVTNQSEEESSDLTTEDSEMSDNSKTVEFTKESFSAQYPNLFEEIRLEAQKEIEEQKANAEKQAAKVAEEEAKVKSLETKLEEASKEADELRAKVDEFELKEQVAKKRSGVQKAIEDSGLENSYVSEVFVEDLMKVDSEEEVAKRIADRKQLVESVSGDVTENGARLEEGENEEVQPEADDVKEEEAPASPEVNLDDLVKSMKSYNPVKR